MKKEIVDNEKQKNNLKDQLNSLNIPTNIIWGKNDSIIPSKHLENLNENIKVNVFDDCGHMAHTEESSKVNEIIKNIK